ncbi:MAG: glycosyltransferase family 2 protein [Nitrosopumilus sp.]|nr:glycosyltransferase family 2 protein [Nitrosopumilus sp.]MDH3385976.1 glycosyltransferase family 2 protein [Nitrosopumilus sp.]
MLRSINENSERSKFAPVAILIPAYNEETTIAQTLDSLTSQTWIPEKIIVIDDFSSDKTGEIARSYKGVDVVRPPKNTGSKAGAQNFAMPSVTSKYTIAVDADTSLDENAIEKMIKFMEDNPDASASCTFVIPKKVKTIMERGRYIEYIFAFTFYKRIQDWYGKPLISSGCFSIYKTDDLRNAGCWSTRTMAEDMDLTWTFYEQGKKIRFNPDNYCYPIEPDTLKMMGKQLTRWSHGLFQNLKLHWPKIKKIPTLREVVIAAIADVFIGGAIAFVVGPAVAILLGDPWLLIYGISSDFAFISVPVMWKGWKLKQLRKVLSSLPSFYLLRWVNGYHLYKAAIKEYLLHKTLTKYEKGH